jgi:nitrile hydratase accessory protein
VTPSADPRVADPDAAAAPPRSNGELVFEAPWESRVFGVAVALHDAGVVDFEAFRARLIGEIGAWEPGDGTPSAAYRYYERWLTALERVLVEEQLVDPARVAEARSALAREWAHDRH